MKVHILVAGSAALLVVIAHRSEACSLASGVSAVSAPTPASPRGALLFVQFAQPSTLVSSSGDALDVVSGRALPVVFERGPVFGISVEPLETSDNEVRFGGATIAEGVPLPEGIADHDAPTLDAFDVRVERTRGYLCDEGAQALSVRASSSVGSDVAGFAVFRADDAAGSALDAALGHDVSLLIPAEEGVCLDVAAFDGSGNLGPRASVCLEQGCRCVRSAHGGRLPGLIGLVALGLFGSRRRRPLA